MKLRVIYAQLCCKSVCALSVWAASLALISVEWRIGVVLLSGDKGFLLGDERSCSWKIRRHKPLSGADFIQASWHSCCLWDGEWKVTDPCPLSGNLRGSCVPCFPCWWNLTSLEFKRREELMFFWSDPLKHLLWMVPFNCYITGLLAVLFLISVSLFS